ncbi:MAG: hypothetical protein P8Q36_12300 [Alphaproteobacteria bacterium]|jgi:hypothetical protein|nr:hypothetical protein [Rhodospirillaceae bacterium]MBT6203906.1 hypothetical protein [Rhodospirillaceae bacterium]MBT6512560.1 hypothetical protein [Rhodospirillaceae bacterium]MBT7648674.1 hypothetical protein [Rhodospirillaceae bacterium]MDG2481632.1 hypothetical protein [Alphaproteobacteria bacterium]
MRENDGGDDSPGHPIYDADGPGEGLRTRQETRNNEAFAQEELQGLMLAARIRMIAISIIVAWQALITSDSGLVF